MPTPRENRLLSDYQKVRQAVADSGGTLKLLEAAGSPPTRYVLEYACPGLVKDGNGQPCIAHKHRVEINLGANYPISQPVARMLTPTFNPHVFMTNNICLGKQWAATETLDTLILRIGAILQLDPKIIDFNSLANKEAGNWARNNPRQLPLPGWVTFKKSTQPASRITWK